MLPEPAMSCRCPRWAGGVSLDAGVFALVNNLRDPRDPRGRQYPLGAVLLIALCAPACRFDSSRAMGQWARPRLSPGHAGTAGATPPQRCSGVPAGLTRRRTPIHAITEGGDCRWYRRHTPTVTGPFFMN